MFPSWVKHLYRETRIILTVELWTEVCQDDKEIAFGNISRKIPGDIPDLVFKYGENEVGCVQIVLLNNGANGTKKLKDKKKKVPKILKSFCGKIMMDYTIDNPRQIKLVAFFISGASFTTSVIAFKFGSIALYTPQIEQKCQHC